PACGQDRPRRGSAAGWAWIFPPELRLVLCLLLRGRVQALRLHPAGHAPGGPGPGLLSEPRTPPGSRPPPRAVAARQPREVGPSPAGLRVGCRVGGRTVGPGGRSGSPRPRRGADRRPPSQLYPPGGLAGPAASSGFLGGLRDCNLRPARDGNSPLLARLFAPL